MNKTKDNIDILIEKFWNYIDEKNISIYNEFSFQHELGYYLRKNLKQGLKIEFERNIKYFDIAKEKMEKKEIDISIYDFNKKEKYCIELKYPRNGQIPEQMFSFCRDIKFLEQLVQNGFSTGYFIALVENDSYFTPKSNSKNDIYRIFRKNKIISGIIQKPTGKKDKSIKIEGSYSISWEPLKRNNFYLLIKVSKIL